MTRRVVVTGGTGGIGLAIARAFAAAGDEVHATGVEPGLAGARDPATGIASAFLDVRDGAAVEAYFGGFDRLDVLVNCAGIIRRGGAEFAPDTFAEVVDINLNGTMRCAAAAHPLLAASRGCVVNIASMLTFFGSPFVPAYSASKGGIGQLTKSLATAWAGEGIRVNAVAPGWVATELTAALVNDPARSKVLIDRTPMGRWGTPADIAGPVLFLCSEAAGFVTGAILPVDGGYSAL